MTALSGMVGDEGSAATGVDGLVENAVVGPPNGRPPFSIPYIVLGLARFWSTKLYTASKRASMRLHDKQSMRFMDSIAAPAVLVGVSMMV